MSDDIFIGTNNNDIFHGGTGADIVSFAGNAAGYRIDVLSDGRVRVVDIDNSDGDTGRDILSGIDTLQFADASFNLESIATAQGQIRINTATTSGQYYPAISALADGGYVTSWVSGSSVPGEEDIYFQRYDANGNTVGSETYVGTYTTRNPFPPPVTVLADGGFVITWGSFTVGQGYDIYAQRYDANGLALGSQTLINTYLAIDQNYAATTALADGGYVITWQSFGEDGSGWGIYAQRYGADGLAVGGETRINTYTNSDQLHPAVTALADGGYVITWESYEQDGSGLGIYAQRYGADGLAVGGETRINTFTTDYQSNSAVAALADGGYLIAWVSAIEADGWTNDIYAQRYDANGNAVGGETRINSATADFQFSPAVTALADGGYVVSWVSDASGDPWNASICAQRYDADGAAVGSEALINANVTGNAPPAVTALADGGYILTWNDGAASAIYAQRFDAEGNAWGAPAQQITGTAGDNVINGGARSQSLLGLDGNDNLRGGGDDDILNGGSGNDMLTGGAGTDTYVFDSALGDGGDRVFSFGPRDRIELDDAVFDMLDIGTLARANFRANAVGNARDGGDYILYNTTNGNLYYDADGDGAGVAIKFAKLVGAPALTATDFEIV